MPDPQPSASASLESKLTVLVASLNDDEAALLGAMVLENGGSDVTGFDLQHTALQSDSQSVPNLYLMLSNIMKTKHDTAKNSISNIR
jgi:hypothetical protein